MCSPAAPVGDATQPAGKFLDASPSGLILDPCASTSRFEQQLPPKEFVGFT
jgi:hypothetical protein